MDRTQFAAVAVALTTMAVGCSTSSGTDRRGGFGGTGAATTGGSAGVATGGTAGASTGGTAGATTGGTSGTAGTAASSGMGGTGGVECRSSSECAGDGTSCHDLLECVQDCRPTDANPCGAGTGCDFTDGTCNPPGGACYLEGEFEACPTPTNANTSCGPGTFCSGPGGCVPGLYGCSDVECDRDGRCWGIDCPCTRPTPTCTPPSLMELNRADFVGSLVNMRGTEGAIELDFDEACNAYVVTFISGPDYLRQLEPDGTLTEWQSTTNLNMGQLAVRRTLVNDAVTLGEVAATYICCATCGCVETGQDGRLGVIRLDRTSTARPLPNVLPAQSTTGTGPFGSSGLDTGPYGLTWDGGENALYVGNIDTNGDFHQIDLVGPSSTLVATFPNRVTAANPYDLLQLMVAVEGGTVHLLETGTGTFTQWASLGADATSIRRDFFTGRVYAEVNSSPMPTIVEISADGATVTPFQTPPFLGRVSLGPGDGFLYHLSAVPNAQWVSMSSVVRWPLPAQR